jgi:hypothetical protein
MEIKPRKGKPLTRKVKYSSDYFFNEIPLRMEIKKPGSRIIGPGFEKFSVIYLITLTCPT